MARPVIACVAVALVLAACAAPMTDGDTSTPSAPTASPDVQSPTPQPSEVASTSFPSPTSPPELALGPDVVAEVVTTDLVMRTAPGIFEESLVHPGRLGPGDRLFLVDGPVSADGFDWYLADPFQVAPDGDQWVRFGWVAAADKTGEAWIIPVEPDCPPDADVTTLYGLPLSLRLACFGDRAVDLAGDVSCADLGPPIPTASPAWMTWDGCYLNPHDAPPYDPFDGTTAIGLAIHYPPGAERLSGYVRITGHFDDPRATDCRMPIPVPEDDEYTQDLEHRAQQLRCRASLVVTDAAPAGDD